LVCLQCIIAVIDFSGFNCLNKFMSEALLLAESNAEENKVEFATFFLDGVISEQCRSGANYLKIIELFQKCHQDHPIAKFWGECTELKIKLDRCFREEKAIKRKANFEESERFKERLRAYRDEMNAANSESPSQAAE
ncbi:hypothetical protein KI387_002094, partial [Taxus chinensis]